MVKILLIETATQVCSVVLSDGSKVLSTRESAERNIHSSVVTLFIKQVIDEAGLSMQDLDAICVSKGPGSYTGLRIGVSTAKGLCYALDKPLIAISTLESMTAGMIGRMKAEDLTKKTGVLLCPMIDARRMEVFNALFDLRGNMIREIKAEIITEGSFGELLADYEIWFFGDGADKCRAILSSHHNSRFADHFVPSAKDMMRLAEDKYRHNLFENIAYFEPFYLKDFIAGKPRVKGMTE
jgi:tRNA threonylcarbamoyladenosine biosynthesis protein TsaB